MRSRAIRRLLWFFAWLVCVPGFGWGISAGNRTLAGIAMIILLISLYFSLCKCICPNCGHAVRTVGARVRHCMRCGTAYPEAA